MSPYIDAAIIGLVGLLVLGGWRFLVRSVRREMEAVVKEAVQPELDKIHKRIDDHMESEEESLKKLIMILAHLSGEDETTIKGQINGR
jgi:hypothetical protein